MIPIFRLLSAGCISALSEHANALALISTCDYRLRDHLVTTVALARTHAPVFGFTSDDAMALELGAFLHDSGKVPRNPRPYSRGAHLLFRGPTPGGRVQIERPFEGQRGHGKNRDRPMNRHGDVPPAGQDLPFDAWAVAVTDRVRAFLPDLAASRSRRVVTWTRGAAQARLDARQHEWWLTISSSGAGTGISTHTERHDRFTADVAASNIVVHFDARYCRGIDVPPYTEHEINVLQGKK